MSDEQKMDDDQIPIVTSAINYPTVYADAVWFAMQFGGVVRLQFIENIMEPANSVSPGIRGRHVGTIAMPMQGFADMVGYLNRRLDDMLTEAKVAQGRKDGD